LVDEFDLKGLKVLAFPCNQFGLQQNSRGEEIMKSLKHVRPGEGFKPKEVMFDLVEVNGANEHPLFAWLKEELPTPEDKPDMLMEDPRFIMWKPVKRNDISWNFEKFLLDGSGRPRRRYSHKYEPRHIRKDVEKLLSHRERLHEAFESSADNAGRGQEEEERHQSS